MLRLYSFFHLNIMFSSIEEENRLDVIKRCYWPLLHLCRKNEFLIGVEVSGYTLEVIASLDPDWIAELRSLIKMGLCELIACGYAQIIGPLVSAKVNRKNLLLGLQVYEDLVGCRPTIALVNEQAYSSGLVPIYLDCGFKGIIMEWENPYKAHQEWVYEWGYHPQIGLGPNGEKITVIWNRSIAFQKFQRYVHGDLEIPELLSFISMHCGSNDRFFPLYGSDVEVLGYRPGRFETEEPVRIDEWARIEELLTSIASSIDSQWIFSSDLLKSTSSENAFHALKLESAAKPIPVKKQSKYNIVRWGVTGRNDFEINTRCFALAERLAVINATDSDWKELCYLWSSDFRTHITEARWSNFNARLQAFEHRLAKMSSPATTCSETGVLVAENSIPKIRVEHKWITVETENLMVVFNSFKGLSIDRYVDKRVSASPLFGTIHHGFFSDIGFGADFFSGNLTYQSPGCHQVTDLKRATYEVLRVGHNINISGLIQTRLGEIRKTWTIYGLEEKLVVNLKLSWRDAGIGRWRFNPVTLMPGNFDPNSLFVETCNGGFNVERLIFKRELIRHGQPASFLVSAQEAVGATNGLIAIGDVNKKITIRFLPSKNAFLGQITHEPIENMWFTRVALTAREVDDTSKPAIFKLDSDIEISSEAIY